MTEYSHPKCYARQTNQCSTKISGEHIISDNILADFEHRKTVKFSGLPWIEKNKFNLLSRKSLVANVLCTKHNEELSPFDIEAGNLMRCIHEFDSDFNNSQPKDDLRQFDGRLIENWMLKTICALIASNQISENAQRKPMLLKDIYIDILFKKKDWPKDWGLYFKIPDNHEVQKFNCLSIIPMTGNGEVKCVQFLLNNFVFYLVLGQPGDSTAWGIHRINKIKLTYGFVTKALELLWGDPKHNLWIEFTRLKSTTEFPANWENWMKE